MMKKVQFNYIRTLMSFPEEIVFNVEGFLKFKYFISVCDRKLSLS